MQSFVGYGGASFVQPKSEYIFKDLLECFGYLNKLIIRIQYRKDNLDGYVAEARTF